MKSRTVLRCGVILRKTRVFRTYRIKNILFGFKFEIVLGCLLLFLSRMSPRPPKGVMLKVWVLACGCSRKWWNL